MRVRTPFRVTAVSAVLALALANALAPEQRPQTAPTLASAGSLLFFMCLQPLVGATLIITPTPSVTIDHDGDVIHLGGVEVTTDTTGTFTVELAHAPDLFYTVRTTAGGRLRPVRFACADITDGTVVDLSDVTPAPAPGPYVEYVKGDPGATLTESPAYPGLYQIGA